MVERITDRQAADAKQAVVEIGEQSRKDFRSAQSDIDRFNQNAESIISGQVDPNDPILRERLNILDQSADSVREAGIEGTDAFASLFASGGTRRQQRSSAVGAVDRAQKEVRDSLLNIRQARVNAISDAQDILRKQKQQAFSNVRGTSADITQFKKEEEVELDNSISETITPRIEGGDTNILSEEYINNMSEELGIKPEELREKITNEAQSYANSVRDMMIKNGVPIDFDSLSDNPIEAGKQLLEQYNRHIREQAALDKEDRDLDRTNKELTIEGKRRSLQGEQQGSPQERAVEEAKAREEQDLLIADTVLPESLQTAIAGTTSTVNKVALSGIGETLDTSLFEFGLYDGGDIEQVISNSRNNGTYYQIEGLTALAVFEQFGAEALTGTDEKGLQAETTRLADSFLSTVVNDLRNRGSTVGKNIADEIDNILTDEDFTDKNGVILEGDKTVEEKVDMIRRIFDLLAPEQAQDQTTQ